MLHQLLQTARMTLALLELWELKNQAIADGSRLNIPENFLQRLQGAYLLKIAPIRQGYDLLEIEIAMKNGIRHHAVIESQVNAVWVLVSAQKRLHHLRVTIKGTEE
jgi:hypothetical protein